MTLGVRARLLGLSTALIAAAWLAAQLILVPALRERLAAQARDELTARARLGASIAAASALSGEQAGRVAEQIARDASAHVWIVGTGGEVLAFAPAPGQSAPPPSMNLRAAGASSFEHHRRLWARSSAPLTGSPKDGALVLASPLPSLEDEEGRLRGLLAVMALFALGLALLLATAATWLTSQVVRAFAAAARRLAAGEQGARVRLSGAHELTDLGRAVDELGTSLFSALRQLRAERDLLSGVLDAMDEGVLVVDQNGRIEHANPRMREMLLASEDPRGKTPLEAVRSAELQALLTEARSGTGAARGELELGGLKPRRMLVRAVPLVGTPPDLLAVFMDVTDLRRLETLRKDFVANVSHELRTPIASIRSAAETLREGALAQPQAAARFVEMIERNSARMQSLVDDLLELARIESRQVRLALEPLDLATAADETVGLVRARADGRGVTPRVEVEPGIKVQADRKALDQVLTNLLDNALKYCPQGARIAVRADPEGDHVRVAVVDDGPGIEPRHLPRLFERFYRADPGRSRDQGGTGLGLAIVKHLVEAMGGSVGVESTPGKGSTFWFTLRTG
jgi:two-component system phosphate regulon sensor histidine kinase PhoR